MPHDELVSIIGNDDDDLFVTYKYADADDTNKFRVYHSSDDGSTWTELIDPYANFIPVEVVSKISSDMPNPSLSFIDDDGNPVYMIRIDVATGLTYEHRFVRYDIDNSEWSQIPLAGLTSDVIFAAAFTQADGKYYIAMPYGLYTSSDLSTWTEEQYTGLLPGLIANSLIVSGNQLYMGTLANGLWTVELEVGVFTQNNDAIRIYPNPATDNLTLSNINQASSVKIIDTEGRVLFYTDDLRENLNVNLSGYAAGIYFVEITTDQKSIVKKIIVD